MACQHSSPQDRGGNQPAGRPTPEEHAAPHFLSCNIGGVHQSLEALFQPWPLDSLVDDVPQGMQLHSFTRLALDLLVPLRLDSVNRFYVYMDGTGGATIPPSSSTTCTHQCSTSSSHSSGKSPPAWAFAVIARHTDGSFAFFGAAGGLVADFYDALKIVYREHSDLEATTRFFDDLTRQSSVAAELVAGVWAIAWAIQAPLWCGITFIPDSTLTIGISEGHMHSEKVKPLALTLRALFLFLSTIRDVRWEHNPAHQDFHGTN